MDPAGLPTVASQLLVASPPLVAGPWLAATSLFAANPLLLEGAVAAGIGLFIGLEREHRATVAEGPPREPLLGVRSFAILSLAGWTTSLLAAQWPWFPALALLAVGALLTAQYVCTAPASGDFGVTTELGALLTFVLGLLVHVDRSLAVTLALAVTLILLSKPWVRSVVPRILHVELTGTLQFLIVLAVVLPLLPEQPLDPWGVLPPRKIGLFVVLVAGIGFVGYVLTRLLGRSRSAALTGLVGGLVSSTALTVAMAQQATAHPGVAGPSRLAVLLANTVMLARVLVVTAVINPAVAIALALPLGVMGAILLLCSAWTWRALRGASVVAGDAAPLPVTNPFALLPALKWGLLLCVVLIVARVATDMLGRAGLYAAAAASGLADVDAITLATSRESALGMLSVDTASLAIALAVLSNTLVKAVMARVLGGRAFGTPILLVLCSAAAAGVGAALLR